MSNRTEKDWETILTTKRKGVKDFFQACRAIFLIILILGITGIILWLIGELN